MEPCTLRPELKKIKKFLPKKLLIFQEIELFNTNIKKFHEMETPSKKLLIFQEMGTLKKLLIFREMELFSPPQEKPLILQKTKTPKKFF